MRPKAYTGKNAPGRASITLLEWMTAAPSGKWFAAGGENGSVVVVARGDHARRLEELVGRWGGEVQSMPAAPDG